MNASNLQEQQLQHICSPCQVCRQLKECFSMQTQNHICNRAHTQNHALSQLECTASPLLRGHPETPTLNPTPVHDYRRNNVTMHIYFCTLPQIQLLSFRTEFAVLSIKPTTTQRQNLCEEEKLKENFRKL